MSQQVNDKFNYNKNEYELVSIEFPQKYLNWGSFKLNPIEISTACYRGFVNTFAIYENNLVLNEIYTNNQTINENGEMETINIHKINGVLPEIEEPDENLIEEYKNYRIIIYKNINLKMKYNGSLLIVKNFIQDYISGPYAFLNISPFCYKDIIKLQFDKGKFVKETNFSDFAEEERNKRKISKNIKSESDAYFDWPDLDVFYKNI